jgi:hypothetical protein
MSENNAAPVKRAPIHFASRQEFEVRPSYVPALRCASDDLDYIVGKYGFSKANPLKCGLNGCNREHWHGFVIATKSGIETHCGQDCGKREFKVSWDDIHADFQRQEKAEARKKLVDSVLQDRNELLSQAEGIQAKLSFACSKIRQVYDEIRKEPILSRSFESAVTNGGRILAAVKIDKDIGAGRGQRRQNANVTAVGRILGVESAAKYHVVGRLFDWGVVRPLRGINEKAIESMSQTRIEEAASQIRNLRTELILANEFLTSSRQFLSAENMEQMEKLKDTLPARARTARLDRIYARLPALLSAE